jgi:peptidyl-prolyl cis-trans isomerase D
MLQAIRDRSQSWIAWAIVLFISIPFALWGLNSYVTGGGPVIVATVAGIDIEERELQQEFFRQRQRMQEMFGGQMPGFFSDEMLREQVLQQLIERNLFTAEALQRKMAVGDGSLVAAIREVEAFYVDGRFSQERYTQLLRGQGLTPAGFEQRLRRDLLVDHFESMATRSEFVTPYEESQFRALSGQMRDVGVMIIPSGRYSGGITLSESEIEADYQANLQRYSLPEQISIDYVELSAAAMARDISISEEEVVLRYNSRQANYRTAEERKASHILLIPNGERDDAATLEQLVTLRQRIEQGESFATLAESHSEDPGSASQGGDLGYFGRGEMDDAFEKAAFSLAPDEISQPVKSRFGYHLIRVESVRGGQIRPLEEVREELIDELRNEAIEQPFYNAAELLANLSYEHPDTLQLVSEDLKLPIQSSPLFSRLEGGSDPLLSEPKIINAAFSDEVLVRRNNSEVIDLGNNRLIVLRLREHLPQRQRALNDVADEIRQRLIAEKSQQAAAAEAQEVLKAIRGGSEAQQEASRLQIDWQRRQLLRDSREIDSAIVRGIFRLPRPAEGETTSEVIPMLNGDHAVVVLYRVEAGNENSVADANAQLRRTVEAAARDTLLNSLRERSKIEIRRQAEQVE